ncbi:hypothetical protein FKV75_03975 [Weissella paramesenteroides]|uniref:hypothetical protein n=1 Tax=Weissella paramesenteroides TaxID=1249 RepID=UPI0012389DC7|nr:hypothetical protein [Weissella paramesenteroides]KAA8440416.1 hypothetical protein FKV77_08030 [Weissella paramesenteroides]KAA8440993.1 hypothetical protein FKV81_04950 [Weissella paramesenteroides]KAA8443424.1 hypothetical protein FKV75_03975 [Weissella paramesenteroides]KAA8447713.1 hypothetical protein FKV76_04195 [Weissella paramesenteroides]KAA8449684.1 hypothetical protein FKV74_05720 [Weissella paramesenteroides]
MHDFKELFLSKLPSPINRFAEDTITFAEWLNVTFQKLIGLYQTIEAFRDINKANGKALDRICDQFNQQRGSADDDFYRIMIRSKQATNMGNSTVNGLINMIARSLDIQPDKIRIESLRQYENGTLNDGEPLAIRISNIPLEWARSDFEQNYILERIKNGVAAGVRVDEVSFVDNSNAVLSVRGLTSATVTYEVKGEG